MAAKPEKQSEFKEVTYSPAHWNLRMEYGNKGEKMLVALKSSHIQAIVHGSIARGDVTPKSDVDVFIPEPPSSFLVETALEKAGLTFNSRYVLQATPNYAMKAHIEIDEKTTVTFPLMGMRRVEREFYRFGGEMNLSSLQQNLRVTGVDKRLMLIEPTAHGHLESSVVGREEQARQVLRVS